MSNIIPHTLTLTVMQEIASLGSSILKYNAEMAKVEIAREQMHRQADIELARIQADLSEKITNAQTLGKTFETLVNANPNDSENILKAFYMLNDTLRTQPRVFTDVSGNK